MELANRLKLGHERQLIQQRGGLLGQRDQRVLRPACSQSPPCRAHRQKSRRVALQFNQHLLIVDVAPKARTTAAPPAPLAEDRSLEGPPGTNSCWPPSKPPSGKLLPAVGTDSPSLASRVVNPNSSRRPTRATGGPIPARAGRSERLSCRPRRTSRGPRRLVSPPEHAGWFRARFAQLCRAVLDQAQAIDIVAAAAVDAYHGPAIAAQQCFFAAAASAQPTALIAVVRVQAPPFVHEHDAETVQAIPALAHYAAHGIARTCHNLYHVRPAVAVGLAARFLAVRRQVKPAAPSG